MLRLSVFRPAILRRRLSTSSIDSHRPSIFPEQPTRSMIDDNRLPPLPQMNDDLIHHLEQLSLVRFSDEAAVHHLVTAVRYAQRLAQIDTEGVQPMYSVLEDVPLRLRSDESSPEDTADRQVILANAVKSVEGMYFVAPVGNVPLEERQDKLTHKEIKKLALK